MRDQETGNVCVHDFRSGAVCTANDVRIEELTVVSIEESCTEGVYGEAEVVFEALVSAEGSPDRYDIGIFIALDGDSALSGDNCYHDYLPPPITPTPTYADSNLDGIQDLTGNPWWDGDADSCGDLESNTQVFKILQAARVECVDGQVLDGLVDVSVAASWDNNTNTTCGALSQAFPGTNSKCSKSDVSLGIPVPPPPTATPTPEPPTPTPTDTPVPPTATPTPEPPTPTSTSTPVAPPTPTSTPGVDAPRVGGEPIPDASNGGQLILVLLMAAAGVFVLRRLSL
jgi:hypothetical protein